MTAPSLLTIVVDGLAQRRLSFDGPYASLIPEIRRTAGRGYMATNCFSHGAPTEFAIAPLMTSTYPLDCGGYQSDFANRPPSFLAAASTAGMETGLVTKSFLLDKLYGFSSGVAFVKSMYDIQVAWRYLRRAVLYHIRERYEQSGDRDAFVARSHAVLTHFLWFLGDLADRLAADRMRGDRPNTRHLSYPFIDIRDRLGQESARLDAEPESYVLTNVPRIMTETLLEFLDLAPVRRRVNAALARLDGLCLPGTGIRFRGYEKNVPTEAALSAMLDWISETAPKPFAAMVHLMDVHDSLYSGNRYFMAPPAAVVQRITPLRQAGISVTPDDLALAYTDACLEDFFARLERRGILRNCRIIITSDHGVQSHNGETCLSSTAPAGPFKDIYLSVPLIVAGPDIAQRRDDRLQQSLNVAPTVCDLIGASAPDGYKGRSVFADDGAADHVICEHQHRGPCDLEGKPIYMAIRTPDFKFVWKEGFSVHDRGPQVHEQLFDLRDDPDENIDVSQDPAHGAVLSRFRSLRDDRVRDIRSDARRQTAPAAQCTGAG
jgi:hypothetical protein